jgi:hypothetical protein
VDLDPIRFLRRRERFRQEVEEEVMMMRSQGERGYQRVMEKLARTDLTSRYRRLLQEVARRLRN